MPGALFTFRLINVAAAVREETNVAMGDGPDQLTNVAS